MPFRIKVSLAIVALLVASVVVVPLVVPISPPPDTLPLPGAVALAARADGELVEAAGVELYTLTTPFAGQGDAPVTFVLLHGYASNAFSFDAATPGLSRLGDVVAFDRPGFGLASRPDPADFPPGENPYGEDAQVAQLAALLGGLPDRPRVLVGVNSGGVLALELALRRPELVDGLVLVGAPAYLLSQGQGAPRWLLKTPQLRRIGPVLMRQVAGPPGTQMYEGSWFDPSAITDEQRAARGVATTVDGWDEALWQVSLAGPPAGLAGRLAEVAAPALVVAGAAAGSVPLSEAERLATELPNATLVQLVECGDLPQEECPQQLVDLVAAWLPGGVTAR